MEPSDSASAAMEEPDSLEVLVKTLDSQTRTFIVGAQVRLPNNSGGHLLASMGPLRLEEQPECVVLKFC